MIDYKGAGKRIRAKRLSLKLTQEAVAERIDVSVGYYSYVESGKRKAGLNTFCKLSKELELSLDYIITGNTNMPVPQDQQLNEINEKSQYLTYKEKLVVIDVINSIINRLK